MTDRNIESTFQSTLKYLLSGHLKNAFDNTRLFVQELQDGKYSDTLDEYQQNYRYLLKYYTQGVNDPERKTIYNKLIARIFILNQILCEELLMRISTRFEFTQKRFLPVTRKFKTAGELADSISYYHQQQNLDETDENSQANIRLRENYERNLHELFFLFWLVTAYSTDEKTTFDTVLQPSYSGLPEKTLIITALTLNLWRMFDENKLMLLLDACMNDDENVAQRALVGLCFVLAKYNDFLPYFPLVRNRLVLLTDDIKKLTQLQNIIIQIISTTETDKISKKLQEEIIPEVMKISPLLKDKMDKERFLNQDDWEGQNPEWQDILEQSGIADKLQEITDLQLEGADVYMSTFAMLKNFPFFSDICNWFLPFDARYSSVKPLFDNNEKNILSAFLNSNVMCNSDKYSFCFSILQMPESQRDVIKRQFSAETEQFSEMSEEQAKITPEIFAKNISKQYIQDLFRFFRLHPTRSDFTDMFTTALIMHRTYLFGIMCDADTSLKENIAHVYFTKKLYFQAIGMFEDLVKSSVPTASTYQKIGYSYQQTKQIARALDAYIKADIIQPDDVWTVKKIALCYRLTENYNKALEYYKHADFLEPDKTGTQLQIGHCYSETGKFKEALHIFYKLDTENEDDPKIMRAIMWTLFLSGDASLAENYAEKISRISTEYADILVRGHIKWCLGKMNEAIDDYILCLQQLDNDWSRFSAAVDKDKAYLINNGIDRDEIGMLLDELLFRASELQSGNTI